MGWKWMGLYQMGPASQWVESAWDGSEWEAPLRNSLTLHELIFWAMVPAVFQFTMTCLQTLTPFTLTLGKGGLGWSRHTSVKLTGRIDQPCSCPWMGTGGPDRVALAKGSFTVKWNGDGETCPSAFLPGSRLQWPPELRLPRNVDHPRVSSLLSVSMNTDCNGYY